ncbi:NAD(P)-binding protein [Xylariaceae sp. FL0594]|nr:NAD(P)-binding protein [Xylariaceae sp. FL0594]
METTGFAFVTGGASGIGKACCTAFAEQGARGVVVADINLEGAKETAREIAAVAKCPTFKAEAIEIDVSLESSVKDAIAFAVRFMGRIDYCVHSASIPGGTIDPIAETTFTDFKRLMDVNVHGTFLVTSLVSAAMKAQEAEVVDVSSPQRGTTRGTIVNMSSLSSFVTVPSMVQYTTSKHAVIGITKSAAIDNVPHNIRVNCICTTWADTPMIRRAMEVAPELEQALVSGIPMGRLVTAKNVADAALFLCGPKSSFMTGTSLIVDGGMSLVCKTLPRL